MSFGGDIMYYESKHYSDDFSTAPDIAKVLFIHEMVHVWQSQSGRNVFAEGLALQVKSLFSDDVYIYGSVNASTKFASLGLEQQAALVEDMFRQKLGYGPRTGNAAADPELIKSLLPFSSTSGPQPQNNKVLVPLPPPRPTEFGGIAQCFLAGTPIALPGDETIAIEDVKPGQDVLAFDTATGGAASPLVARKVVRLFENVTQHVVDFHGLKCTPGHVFLSVDPDCASHTQFATIASILKQDGIVVRQDGIQIRARTNQRIGTIEDVVVRIVYHDPTDRTENHVYARAGIPTSCEIRAEVSGQSKTTMIPLCQLIACLGYQLGADGLLGIHVPMAIHASDREASFDCPLHGLTHRDRRPTRRRMSANSRAGSTVPRSRRAQTPCAARSRRCSRGTGWKPPSGSLTDRSGSHER